ncbi:MAG: hypothetical protein CVV24_06120 [Ignavibacteriae bacterium HGW-Ignavibacteriae-3]|nr:MAG: hypothetical protein CVV24_06120 [Ignavibacteriae bacterium HGW-Ignavibacteriae-3]
MRKFSDLNLRSENAYLLYIAFFKFILLFYFAGNYGLFRDEYYYIECSKHLSFGYVDQPPLSLFILAISRTLFGESILGIRIFAYIAGSATVFVSGLLARELGGRKFAQVLTATTVLFCGVALGLSGYFSMNVFDVLLSVFLFYYIIKLIKRDDSKIWYTIGIIFGIALQNKLTPLFLAAGLAAGMLLTNHRKYFLTKELYLGALIALLIFLPYLIWQVMHGFPTLEFMHNAAMLKNRPMSILEFSKNAMLELNPGFVIFIATAFYFFFLTEEGKKFKLISILFITVFLVFVFNNGKPYYMSILYPVMLAAGAVGADILISRYLKDWVRIFIFVLIIPSAVFVTPFAIPVLDLDSFIKFSEFTGLRPSSGERSAQGILPQFFADRFGWKEMAEKVAEVYNKLNEEEKKNVVIFAQNYGEAGAINYYAKKLGLPDRVYSPHNSYWLWGPPKDWDGKTAIIIGSSREDNSEFFEDVQLAASHFNRYGMPYENVDIFICRKNKRPLKDAWKEIKTFI